MDTFIKRTQPEKYELWLQGNDNSPHPEDPSSTSTAPLPSTFDILCNKKGNIYIDLIDSIIIFN